MGATPEGIKVMNGVVDAVLLLDVDDISKIAEEKKKKRKKVKCESRKVS